MLLWSNNETYTEEVKSLKETLNEKPRNTGKNMGRYTLSMDFKMETTVKYYLRLLLGFFEEKEVINNFGKLWGNWKSIPLLWECKMVNSL